MRLIGTVEAKLDSKGRAFLPAVFRHALGSDAAEGGGVKLILRKDVFENCLVLFPEAEWYRRLDELRSRLSIWSRREQSLLRAYVADAEWVSLDSNGRLLIPKRYLQMTGMGQDVTFVGMDSTIEIWPRRSAPRGDAADAADLGAGLEEIMRKEDADD